MTNVVDFKAMAIATFTTMIERATLSRAGEFNDSERFNPRYGICDNVYLCMDREIRDKYHDQMLMVKDNLIRQVPSYSGAYHYPVRAPECIGSESAESAAERYWDKGGNRWNGAYGDERLTQAKELLDIITNNWKDEYINRMTPATRLGIYTHTVVQHKETGLYYSLSRDDDSSDPYFIPYGETNTDNRTSIRLSELQVVKFENLEERSLTSLVSEMKRRLAKRKKVEQKLKELQAQIAEMKRDEIGLEFTLATQHNVKMINR